MAPEAAARTVETTTLELADRPMPLRVVSADDPGAAGVVVLPALGVPARFYDAVGRGIADRGHHAVVVEFPGQGDSPVELSRRTTIGYQDLLDGEVATVTTWAAEQWSGQLPVLLGHSLGGQLAMLYAASHPDAVRGVALTAAGTIHWRAYPGLAGPGILALTQASRLMAVVVGVFPGHRLGFGGRQPRRLIDDWGRTGLTGRWEPAGATVDHHERLTRLDLPVLAVTMDGDSFAPPTATAALTGLAPRADIDRVTVPSAAAGRAAHFDWLRSPDPVLAEVEQWLGRIDADRA